LHPPVKISHQKHIEKSIKKNNWSKEVNLFVSMLKNKQKRIHKMETGLNLDTLLLVLLFGPGAVIGFWVILSIFGD
jgi:hypothetical protein